MWDDTVLLGIATQDRTLKLTNDTFLALPYGIGMKQGNTALRGRLAPRGHAKAGHVQHDPQEQRRHACSRRSRRTSSGQSVRLHAGDATTQARSVRLRVEGRPLTRLPLAPHDRAARRTRAGVPFEDLGSFVRDNADELAAGVRRTLYVSAIAIAGASIIGLTLGAARAHRIPVVSQLAAVYVEVIRNTPILVQIFMLYYALPSSGSA